MRAANVQRQAALGRAFTVAGVVAIAVIVAMGAVGGAAGGGEPLVLAVAVMATLTTAALSATHAVPPARRVQSPSRGASGHVEASTAYWCALSAPRRPQRPRAPGRA